MSFDYIIVGAGSAGCVLAERLSVSGRDRVLVLEAGPADRSKLISVPYGFGRTLDDPRLTWRYEVETGSGRERWLRGRTLGGSSSVNGMIYVRGQAQDYDAWEAAGARGWGWEAVSGAFRALEDHALGEDDLRGVGGPLHVSVCPDPHPLSAAVIAAGAGLGLERRDDLNRLEQQGIGTFARTILDGRRVSAAAAFLRPAARRDNVEILTDTHVERIVFEGRRARAVEGVRGGVRQRFEASKEVLVCAGALESPTLLQRSGVGDAAHLRELGIEVIADNPAVGANLREHRMLPVQFRLREPRLSINRELRAPRVLGHVLRYLLRREGLLAGPAYEVGAFVRSAPELSRPDLELLVAPFSVDHQSKTIALEREPGAQCGVHPMRPRSQGSVRLRSPDPDVPPIITPNYLADPLDRQVSVAGLRLVRRLFAQAPLAEHVVEETRPGPAVVSADEILAAYREIGQPAYHACGSCRFGADADTALDLDLRVRNTEGLRVIDASIFPSMVSGNTNGPVMAMAWLAAQRILSRSRTAR